MPASVEQLLDHFGPSLASRLAAELQRGGLSPDAARQRISRARGRVRRLSGTPLPNRENFLFLDGEYASPEWKAALAEAMVLTGSAFGRALAGMRARSGVIRADHCAVATGLAVRQAKGHLLHNDVLAQLEYLGLIRDDEFDGQRFLRVWDSESSLNRRRAVEIAEGLMLGALRRWCIKLGLSSSNTLQVRGEQTATYGQFAWDMVGPSYLAPLVQYRKSKLVNGFIVCDVVLDRRLSQTDLIPFHSKWDSLRAQNRFPRLMPMIVAEEFTPEALHELRAKGAAIATPSLILGEQVAADLRSLVATLENAAAAIVQDPSRVFELVGRLAKVEGAAQNVRSMFLELLVARLFNLDGYNIDIRQQVSNSNGEKAEIDVKAVHVSAAVACECKAKAPTNFVNVAEIEDWLSRQVPVIGDFLKRASTLPSKQEFQFITSTGYTDDAKRLIQKVCSQHKKRPIRFLDGNDLRAWMKKLNQNSLAIAFNEQWPQV